MNDSEEKPTTKFTSPLVLSFISLGVITPRRDHQPSSQPPLSKIDRPKKRADNKKKRQARKQNRKRR